MSGSENDNPYLAPSEFVEQPSREFAVQNPRDLRRINNVIHDAGLFWLACLVSLPCLFVGPLFVIFAYVRRLIQWHRYAALYPELLRPNSPLAIEFRNSYWKMVVGIGFSLLIVLLIVGNEFLHIILR